MTDVLKYRSDYDCGTEECMSIRRAIMKEFSDTTAKQHAEIKELKVTAKAFELMALQLTDATGSCPADYFDDAIECGEQCSEVTDYTHECWMRYFLREAQSCNDSWKPND